MSLDVSVRRRWFGTLAVALALVMLVAGLTVLSGRLGPLAFSLYWLLCLLATALAIVVAFRDLRALQRRNLEEQRRLFEATLEQIADEARTKAQRAPTNPNGSAPPRTGGRGTVPRRHS
jgi:type VI protein secretion system component VasK